MVQFGLAWFGLVRFGLVRSGLVCLVAFLTESVHSFGQHGWNGSLWSVVLAWLALFSLVLWFSFTILVYFGMNW